jgi:hypothetical protein
MTIRKIIKRTPRQISIVLKGKDGVFGIGFGGSGFGGSGFGGSGLGGSGGVGNTEKNSIRFSLTLFAWPRDSFAINVTISTSSFFNIPDISIVGGVYLNPIISLVFFCKNLTLNDGDFSLEPSE